MVPVKLAPPQLEPTDRPEAVVPASMAETSSDRFRLETLPDPLFTMSIVMVEVPPGPIPVGEKLLDMDRFSAGKTVKLSLAGLAVRASPLALADKMLVVLVTSPMAAAAGTCTVTVKEHDALAGSEPKVKLSVPVPLNDDPVPQGSVKGVPVAVAPANIASRSSVKVMPERTTEDWFSMSKVRSMVPPASALAALKLLVKRT